MSKLKNYTIQNYLKGGCMGSVFIAEDNVNHKNVAIKKIDLTRCNENTKKNVFREVSILSHLNSRYTIHLLDLFSTIKNGKLIEINLVMPLMDYDLHHVMFTNQFTLRFFQIRIIIYQLLLGLKYLFDCAIIHRDLKPSNIGINENFDVKILDFGLARDFEDDLSKYVVTVWYRPLEVFYTSQYTAAVDMWSLGCIFVEMFTAEVLFKGSDDVDQVKRILSIVGLPDGPTRSYMGEKANALQLFENFASESNQLKDRILKSVEKSMRNEEDYDSRSCDDVIELVMQMIELNPASRITPSEALKSPVFQDHLSDLSSYPINGDTHIFSCEECQNISSKEWEAGIMEKINNFIPRNA